MNQFKIYFQDEHYIAIEKPAGFQVHPPEDPRHRLSRSQNVLFLLRKQTEKYLYPVHRLDRATSGLLVFGFSPEAARAFQSCLTLGTVHKTYFCVVRGKPALDFTVDKALNSESSPELAAPAQTKFRIVSSIEVPVPNKRHKTSRYSLLRAEPLQGRTHQIRRHARHASYPLIGDTLHGDNEHNRIFKNHFGIQGLCLRSYQLDLQSELGAYVWRSNWNAQWHRIFDIFGVCPISSF